ncbi:hypothetical protein V5F41_12400 [Xanthobacter autotrophicus]|uniref:hypothetical protein n=1 Tax=Xanthobacter autotrophicus TaxID=280 RepID=UPI003729DE9A
MDYALFKDFAAPAASVIGALIAASAALSAWRMALKQLGVSALPHLLKERDRLIARIPADDRALAIVGLAQDIAERGATRRDREAVLAAHFCLTLEPDLLERVVERASPNLDGHMTRRVNDAMVAIVTAKTGDERTKIMDDFIKFMTSRSEFDRETLLKIEIKIESILDH